MRGCLDSLRTDVEVAVGDTTKNTFCSYLNVRGEPKHPLIDTDASNLGIQLCLNEGLMNVQALKSQSSLHAIIAALSRLDVVQAVRAKLSKLSTPSTWL